MKKRNIVSLEDRVPKLKRARRKKANRVLIILLLLFFTLIGVVVYFQSPYSHIGEISITGNKYYSAEDIIVQSQLSNEVNIWAMKKQDTIEQLKQLTKIKEAHLKISFPNKLEIKIDEYKTIAYVSAENEFYPILENGFVFKEGSGSSPIENHVLLFQFEDNDVIKQLVDELKKLPIEISNAISEIYYSPTELNKNLIVLYMNDGYEVQATINGFAKKIVHYPSIVAQLDPNEKGLIDLEVGSFFRKYESVEMEDEAENEPER